MFIYFFTLTPFNSECKMVIFKVKSDAQNDKEKFWTEYRDHLNLSNNGFEADKNILSLNIVALEI